MAQENVNDPTFTFSDIRNAKGIPGVPGAEFEVDAQEVACRASLVTRANKDMSYLVGDGKYCIDSAAALTEADAPYSEEIVASLRKISSSVASLAQQIYEISGAAVITSSSSLEYMIKDIRKQVVKTALANAGSQPDRADEK